MFVKRFVAYTCSYIHRYFVFVPTDKKTCFFFPSTFYRARRGLERDGKRDASDGEWAEVQLELIRQVSRVATTWIFEPDGPFTRKRCTVDVRVCVPKFLKYVSFEFFSRTCTAETFYYTINWRQNHRYTALWHFIRNGGFWAFGL